MAWTQFVWQFMPRIAISGALFGWPLSVGAWIYPEHRDIAALAVSGLDPPRRATFDRLWQQARRGDQDRLCEQPADQDQGVAPSCIDWAALSAIAGDHACSSSEMLEQVNTSDWMLMVADVGSQLKADLEQIAASEAPDESGDSSPSLTKLRRHLADDVTRARWTNALRIADTRLQRVDPKYVTRADANLAHFLFPRPDTDLDVLEYTERALGPGVPLNAAGVYAWFHLSALEKASRIPSTEEHSEERHRLALAALTDEAFALHFLEDMFAAGHVAGSWGDQSQRKGTHDYYNENGLEVFIWERRDHSVVLMGDAHMTPEDAALAAGSVRASLQQVIDAAAGNLPYSELLQVVDVTGDPDSFDVCINAAFPEQDPRFGSAMRLSRESLVQTLGDTPIPGLGPGAGAQPRSRSELGTFVGLAGSAEIRNLDGGFQKTQTKSGWVVGLDLGVRLGLGLEGALGESGDGLAFVQLGYQADGASSNRVSSDGHIEGGTLGAALPSRSGISMRLRAPYYLIPGDLLLLSPMYLFDPDGFTSLAVSASNGGLLGLQHGYATRFGRFQFVLGREFGVTWYGLQDNEQLIVFPTEDYPEPRLVSLKSVYFDFPIIEYRPFRSFSADQSSTLLFQLFVGFDKTVDEKVETPVGAPSPDLGNINIIGIRMIFDWRYYW